MEKNQTIEINITDMLDDGRAFGRYEGFSVFVSGGCSLGKGREAAGAVPGDHVTARVTKVRKSSAEAVLTAVTDPSPDRETSDCRYMKECGGCTLRELSYEAQKRLNRFCQRQEPFCDRH